jgi:hypothetical protein
MIRPAIQCMVLFFIAELALTIAFKLSAWCLGKTYDGIAHLVSSKPKDNACKDDDVDDAEFVIISRDEYRTLMHHASSSSLSPSSPPSSSK